jgi:hypothetical protein
MGKQFDLSLHSEFFFTEVKFTAVSLPNGLTLDKDFSFASVFSVLKNKQVCLVCLKTNHFQFDRKQ